MEKNWYLFYTRPLLQKRVASFCKKRNLECYSPVCRKEDEMRKGRECIEPLFISYIFIKTDIKTLQEILRHDAVLSVMYWQDKPIDIKEEEIEAIRHFTQEYTNIQLEKSPVCPDGNVQSFSRAVKEVEGNVYSLSCKTIKVNLPSLGYTLVAEVNTRIPESEKFHFTSELLQQYQ
jgi:transcription antitermination factor NusG